MTRDKQRESARGTAVLTAAGLPLTKETGQTTGRPISSNLKICIAGAHPDDPESACGGLMALYTDAGHEVVSLYLTRGEAGIPGKTHMEAAELRTAEVDAACELLQARPLFAGQIDGNCQINTTAYDAFNAILEAEKPDIVFTHWPIDTHRDHRVNALLVYDAWLRMDRSFQLFYFEVLTGEQTQQFYPTHYVDITSVESRKRKANYAHKSQHPEAFYAQHTQMHRARGRESGVKFAEAYIRHCQNCSL